MAGTIKYMAPIDNASGKIFGRKERFVSVTRKTGNKIRNCRVTGIITKAPTQAMIQSRNEFKLASNYAKSVVRDTNMKTAALAKFAKQSKCHTLRGFLMADYFATEPHGGSISGEL